MSSLSLARARSVWSAAQEIGAGAGGFEDVLERTGFMRTLGGVEVYLAARARLPRVRAREIEAVVAAHRAQVIPAVRGCIYLVARRHVALCLRVAELLSARSREREQAAAGIRPGELEELGRAVIAVLRGGPTTTDALRRALPPGALRSLGDAGKKIGLSSPLPSALRQLEFRGAIERSLEGGRLDTERYLWRLTERSPFEGARLPEDPIDLYARLGELFFRAAGTSTARVFGEWAGIGVRDAQAAIERARLVPVDVEGVGEPSYTTPQWAEELDRARPDEGGVGFLPFEDNLVAAHGGPALLVDPRFHGIAVPAWGSSKPGTLGATKHMATRGIVAEGRLVGLWEYDPRTQGVATTVFDWVAPASAAGIEELAAETARFLTADVGHGRSFSLDTDEALAERADMVRGVGKKAPRKAPVKGKKAAAKVKKAATNVKKAVKKVVARAKTKAAKKAPAKGKKR